MMHTFRIAVTSRVWYCIRTLGANKVVNVRFWS
jgi:hypothetical protein